MTEQSKSPFFETSVEVRSSHDYCVALAAYMLSGANVWPWHRGYKQRDPEECDHHVYGWEPAGFMKYAGCIESSAGTYQKADDLMAAVIDHIRQQLPATSIEQRAEVMGRFDHVRAIYSALSLGLPQELESLLIEVSHA